MSSLDMWTKPVSVATPRAPSRRSLFLLRVAPREEFRARQQEVGRVWVGSPREKRAAIAVWRFAVDAAGKVRPCKTADVVVTGLLRHEPFNPCAARAAHGAALKW